jgi:hypothetical protein
MQAQVKYEKNALRAERQAEKDAKRAEAEARRYEKSVQKSQKQQQAMYERQIQQGHQRAGAFVAAAAGRPITALTLGASSIGPKNTAAALLGAQALRLMPLGGIAANAATAAIVGNSVKQAAKQKAAQQAYYNY